MNFESLVPNDDHREALGERVWLMDNHKWALLAWERERSPGQRYALLHADYHWDANDNVGDDEAQAQVFGAVGLDEIESLTKDDALVRCDSFISAAIRRGFISEVHFYCKQDEADVGLNQSLCDDYQTVQTSHPDADALAQVKPSVPIIFDLCLDLFNLSKNCDGADLWPDEDVVGFIEAVAHHIKAAAMVTVSLSFGYSGSEDDTRHLARLVVPRILELRAG